jgi:hypothetical protein
MSARACVALWRSGLGKKCDWLESEMCTGVRGHIGAQENCDRLLDKEPVSLEQQVEASEDGLEAALENNHAFGTRKVDEVRNGTAGWDARCNALKERAQREQVADVSGKLASWQMGWGLFNVCKEGAAGDRVRSVEDGATRVDVEVVVVLEVFVV